jgi:hypothetical protein
VAVVEGMEVEEEEGAEEEEEDLEGEEVAEVIVTLHEFETETNFYNHKVSEWQKSDK